MFKLDRKVKAVRPELALEKKKERMTISNFYK